MGRKETSKGNIHCWLFNLHTNLNSNKEFDITHINKEWKTI
jgi:hypothetical protein